jgi:hypothetical protein
MPKSSPSLWGINHPQMKARGFTMKFMGTLWDLPAMLMGRMAMSARDFLEKKMIGEIPIS